MQKHTITFKWVNFVLKSSVYMFPHAQNRNSTIICFLTTNILNLKLNFTTSWVLDQNLEMISLLHFQFSSLPSLCNWHPRCHFARCRSMWNSPQFSPLKAKLWKGGIWVTWQGQSRVAKTLMLEFYSLTSC